MKKLSQLLNKSPLKGDVGIEIEMEGKSLPPLYDDYWTTVGDGSLRSVDGKREGGLEYILKLPISLEEIPKALELLNNCLKNSEVKPSFRTSVHVHVNALDMTCVQLMNMIYTYLLIEEPLINFCGKVRKGNRFCLRLQDAEKLSDSFTQFFKEGEVWLKKIPVDELRYAAINIEAVNKYGSVEFRSMRGTTDVEIINTWCKALVSLREFAKKQENPISVLKIYRDTDYLEFLKEVLGDVAPKFKYGKLERDMLQSFSLSLDLPHAYKASLNKKENKQETTMKYKPIDLHWDDLVANIPVIDDDHQALVRGR